MSHHTAITWGKAPGIAWTARAQVEAVWLLPAIASTLANQTDHPTTPHLALAVCAAVEAAAEAVDGAFAFRLHPSAADTGDEEITILVHDDGWSIEYSS